MARRNLVATLIGVTLLVAGAAGFANASSGSDSQDQCSLPLSQRVGGWVCPAETRAP